MLFANQVISNKPEIASKVFEIIDKDTVLKKCPAYHLDRELLSSCMAEDNLIANEVIDGASSEINDAYDSLFSVSESAEE